MEHVNLDPWVIGSSPTLGVEINSLINFRVLLLIFKPPACTPSTGPLDPELPGT